MQTTYTTQSGAILLMSVAPFDSSKKLFRALMSELKAVDLDLEGFDLRKLSQGNLAENLAELDIKVNTIKNAFVQILGSERFEQALHECFVTAPCLYNNQKITKVEALFNSPDARGDYFGCAWEVASLNLRCFFPKLESKSYPLSVETKNGPR